MVKSNSRRMRTETLVLSAVITALVIVLQSVGAFIRLGPFQCSLVLMPIVIGAALCGTKTGAWLGFIFGAVVLFNGDAAAFLTVNAVGTVITVLAKGIACGLCAGIVYRALSKKSEYLGVLGAAIAAPVVNTGIFLLGCLAFFFETIEQWGLAAGFGTGIEYMFLGLAGGNFLLELITNIVLCPVIIRILSLARKNVKKQ